MANIVVNKDAANVITYTATDTTQPEAFFFTVKRMSLPKDYILQKQRVIMKRQEMLIVRK